MPSIQHQIYLKRAGLLSESSLGEKDSDLEKKIRDYVDYLRQHDGEEPDEYADDYEHDKEEEKELSEAVKKEKKEGEYTSNDKGILHELLVGHHLNGGKHMDKHPDKDGDTPEQAHDKIKQKLFDKHGNHDEYNRLNEKAKSAAADLRKQIEVGGRKIHTVHWTSKPGDIKRSTGIESSQKEDASDIMVHTRKAGDPKTKFHGVSLKVTDGTDKNITASNPGMEATRGAQHMVDEHKARILRKYPELLNATNAKQRKEIMEKNPEMKAHVLHENRLLCAKMAKHIAEHLNRSPSHEMAEHIRTHVLQCNKTPLQENGHEHIRHTTYQSGKRAGNKTIHNSIDPSKKWNHILDNHHNIVAHPEGGTVHFWHKGKLIATHRMRVASSSDPTPSFKGDGKAYGD